MYIRKIKNVDNLKTDRKLSQFDLFTRRKRNVPGPVKDAKEVFTFRGDRYSTDPDRQLKYLLGIIKNYQRQYSVMILRDNHYQDERREVLKILNGVPTINRIPGEYTDLIPGFQLPEYLSYEIKH